MKETTGYERPEFTEQSMKHTVLENKAWGRNLMNNQGQRVDVSNNMRGGRDSAFSHKTKQSFASLFKDNRAPIEASLLSYISPTVGEIYMEFIPAWIQIFGLPKQCWTSLALSRIASVIGKPTHTDLLTINKKKTTYARVLVEIDVKKPRIFEYSVKLPTGISTIVRFKYEDGTKYGQSTVINANHWGILLRCVE